MPTPTQPQINAVLTNLVNMQDFNDYVYNKRCTAHISNAYDLLSEPDSTDKGLVYVLNLFEAAFKVLGGFLGPGGAFASNFLVGMMGYWSGNPPSSLNAQFAKLIERTAQTSQEVDNLLADFHSALQNAETMQATWDTQFTYNGQTTSVGDLANVIFPVEADPSFYPMVNAAAKSFDQQIWKQMLVNNYRVRWRDFYRTDCTDKDTPPIKWVQEYIDYYKNTYYTYCWHQGGGGDCSLWIADEYAVEKNVTGFYELNEDCCNYIFIDSTPGTIINQEGLFTRQQVMDFLGIQYHSTCDGTSKEYLKEYLKAEQEGKTLLILFKKQGREAIENRVIQKAQDDALFAHNLNKNPKQTIEGFFDIKIPELVQLTVVLANSSTYGLVIHSDHSFSKESNTFFDFLKSQGYDTAESDISRKIKSDKIFGSELAKNPKNTLDKYFSIKMPELNQLAVVLEDPMNFGLVISKTKGISD